MQAFSGSFIPTGRIRIDILERSSFDLSLSGTASIGGFLAVFPDILPRLDIIAAAGQAIPEGTGNSVNILLPFNAPTRGTHNIRAENVANVLHA